MVNPLSYILLHNRCNKYRGMFYPVGRMVHIKDSTGGAGRMK